jgi:hypothetical protein
MAVEHFLDKAKIDYVLYKYSDVRLSYEIWELITFQ